MDKVLHKFALNPNTGKVGFVTLYEYPAKIGDGCATTVWLLEKPKIGWRMFGHDMMDGISPRMKGNAFKNAEPKKFFVDGIQHRGEYDFLLLSEC